MSMKITLILGERSEPTRCQYSAIGIGVLIHYGCLYDVHCYYAGGGVMGVAGKLAAEAVLSSLKR